AEAEVLLEALAVLRRQPALEVPGDELDDFGAGEIACQLHEVTRRSAGSPPGPAAPSIGPGAAVLADWTRIFRERYKSLPIRSRARRAASAPWPVPPAARRRPGRSAPAPPPQAGGLRAAPTATAATPSAPSSGPPAESDPGRLRPRR